MGKRVYLGLGSNLGNKERIVRKAIDKVGERVGAVVAVSSFYKTAPWGYQSVHTFCNAAIAVDTDLSPEEVLFTVQEIERELGSKKHRERDGSYVDRLIDIDLLDYDGLVLDTHSLVLPHPYMHKRTFVMTPLAEIAPQWVHPVLGKTVTFYFITSCLFETGFHIFICFMRGHLVVFLQKMVFYEAMSPVR